MADGERLQGVRGQLAPQVASVCRKAGVEYLNLPNSDAELYRNVN